MAVLPEQGQFSGQINNAVAIWPKTGQGMNGSPVFSINLIRVTSNGGNEKTSNGIKIQKVKKIKKE